MFFLIFISPNMERLKTIRIYVIYLQLSSDTGLSDIVFVNWCLTEPPY